MIARATELKQILRHVFGCMDHNFAGEFSKIGTGGDRQSPVWRLILGWASYRCAKSKKGWCLRAQFEKGAGQGTWAPGGQTFLSTQFCDSETQHLFSKLMTHGRGPVFDLSLSSIQDQYLFGKASRK